jgi:hypothetical protein
MPGPLAREAALSLALLETLRARGRRTDVPGWIWLRAARAAWISGKEEQARQLYAAAAPVLISHALEAGSRIGCFEQYAQLAMGAAWMARDRPLLTDVCQKADAYAEGQLAAADAPTPGGLAPADPLTRVTLVLTRIRAAWYRGQKALVKHLLAELDRRTSHLDAAGKALWQGERGFLVASFHKATASIRPDAMQRALLEFDRWLERQRARPPTISDLVDEEFISFARGLADYHVALPKLTTPVRPG